MAEEKIVGKALRSAPCHTNQVLAAHNTWDSLQNFLVCEEARKWDALHLEDNTLWRDLEPNHNLHLQICRSLSAWLLP